MRLHLKCPTQLSILWKSTEMRACVHVRACVRACKCVCVTLLWKTAEAMYRMISLTLPHQEAPQSMDRLRAASSWHRDHRHLGSVGWSCMSASHCLGLIWVAHSSYWGWKWCCFNSISSLGIFQNRQKKFKEKKEKKNYWAETCSCIS